LILPILFEDGEALVIDKPAGLPLDRPRAGGAAWKIISTMKLRLPARRSRFTGSTRIPRAACCWRAIPRPSSAFPPPSKRARWSKVYLGVVATEVKGEQGTIDLSLAQDQQRLKTAGA
jgi:tRNA pseudouridine32 synthase/23S rRNA pseudouridine746 synthase